MSDNSLPGYLAECGDGLLRQRARSAILWAARYKGYSNFMKRVLYLLIIGLLFACFDIKAQTPTPTPGTVPIPWCDTDAVSVTGADSYAVDSDAAARNSA